MCHNRLSLFSVIQPEPQRSLSTLDSGTLTIGIAQIISAVASIAFGIASVCIRSESGWHGAGIWCGVVVSTVLNLAKFVTICIIVIIKISTKNIATLINFFKNIGYLRMYA